MCGRRVVVPESRSLARATDCERISPVSFHERPRRDRFYRAKVVFVNTRAPSACTFSALKGRRTRPRKPTASHISQKCPHTRTYTPSIRPAGQHSYTIFEWWSRNVTVTGEESVQRSKRDREREGGRKRASRRGRTSHARHCGYTLSPSTHI